MALATTGVAGAGVGGGLAVAPGTAFGGNALASATPAFQYGPSGTGAPSAANSGGPSGAGGAFDLRSWERAQGTNEDLNACLGVDLGVSSVQACVYLAGAGCKAVSKVASLPTTLLIDPKTGARGMRRWAKRGGRGGNRGMPKGVEVGLASGRPNAVSAVLRLLALRGKGEDVSERVKASLGYNIRLASKGDPEAEDTSGVSIRISSPDATEEKDREYWCSAEDLLAVLLATVKAYAEEEHGVTMVTCALGVPACFGDAERVAVQRAVFLAGLAPGKFVGAPLAAAVGVAGEASQPPKSPELLASISMGASFLDVCIIERSAETAEAAAAATGRARAAAGTLLRVVSVAGDGLSGGLDMDYQLARAMQVALEDEHGPRSSSSLLHLMVDRAGPVREQLSQDLSATLTLAKGDYAASPDLEFSMQVSRGELQQAVAETTDRFARALKSALDAAGAMPGQIKEVVLIGGCPKTPVLFEQVLTAFPKARVVRAAPDAVARGLAMMLASKRGLLDKSKAGPVRGTDVLPLALGLVNRAGRKSTTNLKKASSSSASASKSAAPATGQVDEFFPRGAVCPCPGGVERSFGKGAAGGVGALGAGLELDVEVVQRTGSPGLGEEGEWVTVQRLGNPLATQGPSGYPVLADASTLLFTLDDCGIVSHSALSYTLPPAPAGPGPARRALRTAGWAVAVAAVLGGGYMWLQDLASAGERAQAAARVRLTRFYEENNPDKLDSVEDALRRYKGRENVLFKRLEDKYGMTVPKYRD